MKYQEVYRRLNKKASNEQIKKLASIIGMRKRAFGQWELEELARPINTQYYKDKIKEWGDQAKKHREYAKNPVTGSDNERKYWTRQAISNEKRIPQTKAAYKKELQYHTDRAKMIKDRYNNFAKILFDPSRWFD